MDMKLPGIAMIFCTLTNAVAGTTSIGSISARGDMRVDGHVVNGDATLFNGSIVETDQASAVLHVEKGVEIKFATGSRGTLYSDHLVLERGSSAVSPSTTFQVQANGLHVTAGQPNSNGEVALNGADTLTVSARAGEFEVTNDSGVLLARVVPGHALSFGALPDADPGSITVSGTVTVTAGVFFLSAQNGVVYEVRGTDLTKSVGKTVTLTGTIDTNATPASGATSVLVVSGKKKKEGGIEKPAIIAGIIVGAAVGIGIAEYEANKGKPKASR